MATSSLWSASASCTLVWLGARLGAAVVVVVVSVSWLMWTGLDGAEFLPSALSDSPGVGDCKDSSVNGEVLLLCRYLHKIVFESKIISQLSLVH